MPHIFTKSENKASNLGIYYLPKVKDGLAILAVMKHADFAARFQEACKASQAPQAMSALGRWLGVSTTMAWNYHAGEKLPSMEKAIEIASKLGVCVEWLLTGRGPKTPPKPPDEMIDISDLPPETRAGLRVLIESMKSADKNQRAA